MSASIPAATRSCQSCEDKTSVPTLEAGLPSSSPAVIPKYIPVPAISKTPTAKPRIAFPAVIVPVSLDTQFFTSAMCIVNLISISSLIFATSPKPTRNRLCLLIVGELMMASVL